MRNKNFVGKIVNSVTYQEKQGKRVHRKVKPKSLLVLRILMFQIKDMRFNGH